MAIDKLLDYRSRPDDDGEALVHPTSARLDKTASEIDPDVREYIAGADRPPGDHMRVLITALSAFDTFGPNANGDGFYREDLLDEKTYEQDGERFSMPMFRSFERFARPYKYHINRPTSPAYGKIERAMWNPKMDRVELVAMIDAGKAPDIAKKIDNYEPVKTSMGFRADPYDVCSVCGNRASSRREYCSHLKNKMLDVRPDGHVIHARNPVGKFFDISFVDDPADPTSHAVHVGQLPVMDGTELGEVDGETATEAVKEARRSFAKTAAAQPREPASAAKAEAAGLDGEAPLRKRESVDRLRDAFDQMLEESARKVSAIDKQVPVKVQPVDAPRETQDQIKEAVQRVRQSAPMISEERLEKWASYPLQTVAASAAECGISLRPEEAQHVALAQAGAEKTARRMRKIGAVLEPKHHPEISMNVGPGAADPSLVDKIASDEALMQARSYQRPYWEKRIQALSQAGSQEKTAALGPNPYLRHRENVESKKVYPMASPPERERLRRSPENGQGPNLLDMVAYLLGGVQRRSDARRSRQRRRVRRSGRQPRPRRRSRPQRQSVMTMPVAHYVRGTDATQPIYPKAGVKEAAMNRDNDLRRAAARHIEKIAHRASQLEKSAMAGDPLQHPDEYDAATFDAAALRVLA